MHSSIQAAQAISGQQRRQAHSHRSAALGMDTTSATVQSPPTVTPLMVACVEGDRPYHDSYNEYTFENHPVAVNLSFRLPYTELS